jgi:hypothetical protein
MKLTLARLACAVWLAWLLALGVMVGLSCGHVLHASLWWLAVPLVVQGACTIAALGGGIWRACRGPRRGSAVVWTLFAVLPTLPESARPGRTGGASVSRS